MNTLMKRNEVVQRQGRGKGVLANVILAVAIGLIAVLAIPAALLIGVIYLIWSAADRMLRWLDQ